MEGVSQLGLNTLQIACDLPESLAVPPPGVMDDINIASYTAVFRDGGSLDTVTAVLSTIVAVTWSPPRVTNGELTQFQAWLGVVQLVDETPTDCEANGCVEIFEVI